jgi:large subunit ribosomal protein L28
MSYICDNCGKETMAGRSQHHRRGVAGKRWRKRAPVTLRLFKPNLQKFSVIVDGKKVSRRLCAKCIKRIKKEAKTQSSLNFLPK